MATLRLYKVGVKHRAILRKWLSEQIEKTRDDNTGLYADRDQYDSSALDGMLGTIMSQLEGPVE